MGLLRQLSGDQVVISGDHGRSADGCGRNTKAGGGGQGYSGVELGMRGWPRGRGGRWWAVVRRWGGGTRMLGGGDGYEAVPALSVDTLPLEGRIKGGGDQEHRTRGEIPPPGSITD